MLAQPMLTTNADEQQRREQVGEEIMGAITIIGRIASRLLLLTCFMFVALGGSGAAFPAEQDWLDAMMQAVLAEQAKDGGEAGLFSAYVAQLARVRTHLLNGESEAVYRTMNRFMEMLQARESGISEEVADRLLDYCYVVTPAQYHDVSRHLHRLS